MNLLEEDDGLEKMKGAFVLDVPRDIEGGPLFDALTEEYDGEELAEVAAETVLTLKAECSADDFHNWDYDHLTSIIELSNRFGFKLPKNVVNGLPEQLIILVDHKKLGQPGCD